MPLRLSLLIVAAFLAQHAAPHVARDGRLQSASVGRTLPYRVLLPAGYDTSTRRYPVLYLLHGLDGRYTDWTERTQLAQHLAGRDLIVVTPEGANSWYVNWQEGANERWEDYVVKDVILDIDARFRTHARRETRYIAGLSMGGYGAIRLGLKYPRIFSVAASFSGAFHAARLETFGWSEDLRAGFLRAFGPMGGDHRTANDLLTLARATSPDEAPLLYFDCGTSDPFIPANRELAAILQERRFAYEYREVAGAHTWDYWNRQIAEFLRTLMQERRRR